MSPSQRSRLMAKIRGKNAAPELVVRQLLWASGLRYRLHVTELPGTPDIVLKRFRTAIFVHGCFWHRHCCARGRSMPTSRRAFWRKKFEANQKRDQENARRLRTLGWKVLVVWECETRSPFRLAARLSRSLQHARIIPSNRVSADVCPSA